MTSEKCLFCSMNKKEIKVDFVYEDEHAFAIRDINPQAPTHILIIPRQHVDNISKLDDKAIMGSLFHTTARIADQENLTKSGFRLVVNTGDDGGQTVHHLHIHLLGGRSLTWPPG
ncbi:MAG: histidine triad nucleotide-binding protein [Cyanobacteria bacterium REEB67]|nr:histidine triad nucleotide-binding protein [Cyanobacteria bacterium REEB67]